MQSQELEFVNFWYHLYFSSQRLTPFYESEFPPLHLTIPSLSPPRSPPFHPPFLLISTCQSRTKLDSNLSRPSEKGGIFAAVRSSHFHCQMWLSKRTFRLVSKEERKETVVVFFRKVGPRRIKITSSITALARERELSPNYSFQAAWANLKATGWSKSAACKA